MTLFYKTNNMRNIKPSLKWWLIPWGSSFSTMYECWDWHPRHHSEQCQNGILENINPLPFFLSPIAFKQSYLKFLTIQKYWNIMQDLCMQYRVGGFLETDILYCLITRCIRGCSALSIWKIFQTIFKDYSILVWKVKENTWKIND